MAKSMSKINEHLFIRLGVFCKGRGVSVAAPHEGGHRYVEGDDSSDEIIKRLKISTQSRMLFGSQRAIVQATLKESDFLILVGFENLNDYVNALPEIGNDVFETECLPGHVVSVLSELDIRPTRNANAVQAFVEVADSTEESYEGHSVDELKSLFPTISVYQSRGSLDEDSFQQLVVKFAVAESAFGGGWIGEALLDDLLALASISVKTFPYEALSRAAFDADPRNMYLALYRCLEATYAYKATSDLAQALGLHLSWNDLARMLVEKLRWRPREGPSLEAVLQHATEADLAKVLEAFNKPTSKNQVAAAATAIYDLRNRIVHFGPSLGTVGLAEYDWNALCRAMVGVVYDVFHRAFDSVAA